MLDAIDALLERPKSSRFAWTRRDQWHVTLQFYGRVDDVDGLREGDPRRRRGVGTRSRIAVRGGGAFPNPKNAQVFWLGVDGADALIDLHATVAAATRPFIDRRDRIAFAPAPHARPGQAHGTTSPRTSTLLAGTVGRRPRGP